MTRSDMLDELRGIIDDSLARSAWSDSRLLSWLADGQDKFCEETGFITDARTHTVTLAENISVYSIPERVIEIYNIYDGARELTQISKDTPFFNTLSSETPPTGIPASWRADQETGSIILYPAPNADYDGKQLILHVWRYSVARLDDPAEETYPEIPPRFHSACVEWAAYRALNNHDAEAQDPIKAADHLRFFKSYVSDGKAAYQRIQSIRPSIEPSPVYRT